MDSSSLVIPGIALVFVALFGGIPYLLWRSSKRRKVKAYADLRARPLLDFQLEPADMRAYGLWLAGDLDDKRRRMLARTWRISLWISGLISLVFVILSAIRSKPDGVLLGLAFSGLILLPVWLAVGSIAMVLWYGARRHRDKQPQRTRVLIGTQGTALEPGGFTELFGAPYAANLLAGPPPVVDLIGKQLTSKGAYYWHARAPVPAAQIESVRARLAELARQWKTPS